MLLLGGGLAPGRGTAGGRGMRARMGARATLAMLAVVLAQAAWAVQPDEVLADPALEHRARQIGQVLRCPVCQGENIDESNAPISRDLRLYVRERLTEGDSDAERAWMAEVVAQVKQSAFLHRYGTIDEQVAPILFLASDEAGYITGSILPVAGGDLG